MNMHDLQHKETLMLETLLLALDARENAKQTGTPLLLYVTELLVQRTRDELRFVRVEIEAAEQHVKEGDAAA